MNKVLYISVIILATVLCGCKKGGNNKRSTSLLADPEETMSIDMLKEKQTVLQFGNYSIAIDKYCNFTSVTPNTFIGLYGKVQALAVVDSVPVTGYSTVKSAVSGYGYVVRCGRNAEGGHARLFVTKYLSDDDDITGVSVKFQYPWTPSNDGINVDLSDNDTPVNPQDPSGDPSGDQPVEHNDYYAFWQRSTWHFVCTAQCEASGQYDFYITFNDINTKTWSSSDIYNIPWLGTALQWESYTGNGWRITLRGYDNGHTSFDFDCNDLSNHDYCTCEYHHWDINQNFCSEIFVGTRVK